MKRIQKLFLIAMGAILLAANAEAGRWLTTDPIEHMERDPQSTSWDIRDQANLYQFNYNNPVNYFDPDGRHPLIILFIAGAVIGGASTPYVANAPGYIAPGVPEPTYPAVTTDAILGNALMGGVLNVGLGGAGMITDGGLSSMRPSPCPVSRWGKSGPLESGDWIMEGPASKWNYWRSGKWEDWHPFNQSAPLESGQTFPVSPDTIRLPSGLNFFRGLPPFNQRIYVGPTVQPISGLNAPPSSISFPR